MLRAQQFDVFAISRAVEFEIASVLERPKFRNSIHVDRRNRILRLLRDSAVLFDPAVRVTDCRDAKDNKYLELALAAGADMIVSSDDDLLTLHKWRGVSILRPAAYLVAR